MIQGATGQCQEVNSQMHRDKSCNIKSSFGPEIEAGTPHTRCKTIPHTGFMFCTTLVPSDIYDTRARPADAETDIQNANTEVKPTDPQFQVIHNIKLSCGTKIGRNNLNQLQGHFTQDLCFQKHLSHLIPVTHGRGRHSECEHGGKTHRCTRINPVKPSDTEASTPHTSCSTIPHRIYV